MVQRFTIKQGVLVESGEHGEVANYYKLKENEISHLVDDLGISRHTITSCLDHEEVPRYEMEAGMINIIWKMPAPLRINEALTNSVLSIGLFVRKGELIVVSEEKFDLLGEKLQAVIGSIFDLVLAIQYGTMISYIEHLRILRAISREIQDKISTAMENKYLLKLFDINEVLVYYFDSISGDKSVLEKMKLHTAGGPGIFDELFYQDLINETDQAKKQAEIYSQVLSGLMDARGTVVNNNMNILIKNLTFINIIFLPLNLIASIGGMSEFSAMTKNVPWPLSYGLFTAVMAALGLVLLIILVKTSRKAARRR